MASVQRLTTCLWFDDQAEEAANFYTEVFDDGRITRIQRYPEAGHDVHGRPAGSVMTVEFELGGHGFLALNGGPHFTFNPAVSIVVNCETQEEIDYYWEKLGEGGDPKAQQCGWLADRFGLSWQIVPAKWSEYYDDHESEATNRAMDAMMGMKKLDIAAMERAYRGEEAESASAR